MEKGIYENDFVFVCDSREEAIEIEEVLVCPTFIARKDVYNEKIGGSGNKKGYSYYLDAEGNYHYLSREEFQKRTDLTTRKHTQNDKSRMKKIRREFLDSLTSEEYQEKYCGRVTSEETKQKISSKQKGVKRRPLSDAEKDIKREKSKSFWDSCDEEERKTKCRTKNPENEAIRRKKISENLKKPKETTVCPHCGKIGGIGAMKRYHLDNYKFKSKEQ